MIKIHVFPSIFLIINLLSHPVMSGPDIQNGYQVTLAIPPDYTQGFLGRAFVMETDQRLPHFKTAVSVEAVNGKYSCSVDVLLGDVRVWSSGHLSRFHTTEKCMMEMTLDGDLRLKDPTGRVGWRSGTSGQGVKRLILLRTGNLVLVDDTNSIKWQSFNFPTDTILWGQRLSSQTRLTSFFQNTTSFYSLEIQDDKIGLYLNLDKSKYSYWEYDPSTRRNITFVQMNTHGLEIFNGDHKFDQIKWTGAEAIRFLAVDNRTGNLRMYYYKEEEDKFEVSYQAVNFSCDLPLTCDSYSICRLSGSCSCIRVVEKDGFGPDCNKGEVKGVCGKKGHEEMVELEGVVSVVKSLWYERNVSKEECGDYCLRECGCLAIEYCEDDGLCYVYGMVRGIKEIVKGSKRVRYMVKMVKVKRGSGLKKWVVIVVGVVDGFVVVVVLGGVGYYVIYKRRKCLLHHNN